MADQEVSSAGLIIRGLLQRVRAYLSQGGAGCSLLLALDEDGLLPFACMLLTLQTKVPVQ